MNVLRPEKKATLHTLLKNNISQREISRKSGIDRKTIRKYARKMEQSPVDEPLTTCQDNDQIQNPPPRPPGQIVDPAKIPFHARSACEPHRKWIEQQVRLGRNATAIYQDLVEQFNFNHKYSSVKRFIRGLKQKVRRVTP